jgi:hypothetical protein
MPVGTYFNFEVGSRFSDAEHKQLDNFVVPQAP